MATRRQVFGGLLALAGGYAALRWGLPAVSDRLSGLPPMSPLARPAGFRALPLSEVSQGLDPLIGLEPASALDIAPTQLDGRLCEALFGPDPIPNGVVPIASFSDYHCIFCRVLTPRLQALSETREDIRLKWHELPILGPQSDLAARAALAAGRQGAYAAMHARLIRAAFQPSETYLRAVTQDLGLDADRLIQDMRSPEITEALLDSRALAQVFDLVGTPALVVGRTLVQGEISSGHLDQLIALERREGPLRMC